MDTNDHRWNLASLAVRKITSGLVTGYCAIANAGNEKQIAVN
jgi:hypothetical protein